ncbi:MAG: hypothetical protein ACYC53_08120 [Bacillota bacterium]
MDANKLLSDRVSALYGKTLEYTRLAANSLLLYFGCEPGDAEGIVVWLEPTWHVSAPEGVLIGSRQAGTAAKEGTPEMDRVAEPLARLRGQAITGMEVDPRSRDLTIIIAETYMVRTFVNDPGDDEIWHILDYASDLILCASPKGLTVRKASLGRRREAVRRGKVVPEGPSKS